MKKEIKVVVSIVLAVWFFFMGFEIGSYKEKKAQNTSATPSQNVGQVDVPTVPTEPTTIGSIVTTAAEITTTAANVVTTESGSQAATSPSAATTAKANDAKDPSAMSKEEILQNMTKAINAVKAEQNMTAVRTETVTINLTDLSLASLKNTVNNIIQNLAGERSSHTTSKTDRQPVFLMTEKRTRTVFSRRIQQFRRKMRSSLLRLTALHQQAQEKTAQTLFILLSLLRKTQLSLRLFLSITQLRSAILI